ncbi:hypothetical protein VPH35_014231 [Triticum aestivum]
MPWLRRQRVPSVLCARKISHLEMGPSRCPASISTTQIALYPGWSSTIRAPFVALSCPPMILIMRAIRPQTHSQLLVSLLLLLHLGALVLLRKEGRRVGRLQGWWKGDSMCHCHGRLVDRQVKHHSKMGTMPVLAVAHRTAVRRMELVAVTKIEHKSVITWRFPCRRCVQRSTMLMRHRELYYRQSKDQRNLQPVYLVEQNNVGFSCRCRCPLGRVRKAQRLPWQEVVRCVDSLCRFVKSILVYGPPT